MTFRQYNLQKKRSRYNAYIKYRHFVPKIFRSFIEYPILSPKNKNKYNFDLYISLGNNCISAMTLKPSICEHLVSRLIGFVEFPWRKISIGF